MSDREVVVTGTGLLTALGRTTDENWGNLRAMKTGISRYPADDETEGTALPEFLRYAGRIRDLAVPDAVDSRRHQSQMRFLNRGGLLGFCAAYEAVSGAGIDFSNIPPERRALYIATGDFSDIGYDFLYPATKEGTRGTWQQMDFERLNESTLNTVNPFFLLESIHNNPFSFISSYFEFMGPNTSLASLSPCGGHAIELAYRSISIAKADVAMVIGCGHWINEVALYELEGLGLLSHCREGAQSFRPFDRNRDGFIAGEGGAGLVLEARETAEKRGAEVLATIKGNGNCTEFLSGRGINIPDTVVKRTIIAALEEGGCSVHDLAFILPHGSGTQKGDRSELRSIADILGKERSDIPICGMKPYTGHMGAASDVAEVILGIRALKDRIVPATPNFRGTEEEFSGLNIKGSHAGCEKTSFLSVSYGIGGNSSSVVVEV